MIKCVKKRKKIEIYFSPETINTIKKESEKSPRTETGGILLGRRFDFDSRVLIIVYATSGPGPRAFKTPIAFAPDIDHYNGLLIDGKKRLGLDYLGEWHKHPAGFEGTSLADLDQVKKILAEEDRDFMVCPIVFEKTKRKAASGGAKPNARRLDFGRFAINVFYFSRGSKTVKIIPPKAIHRNSAVYRKLVGKNINADEF
ncbi:MAG TPA: hypothetical protein PKW98_08760 [Candidatus Wallbacteria bacterium]|mgnify:FL=1|nr:MAG: hypothetical protein BWY32_03574 [bacterium ADurb.Bin243]HPG57897.1 hypothetical protein [Candidatus Wallbacteria bacterium]